MGPCDLYAQVLVSPFRCICSVRCSLGRAGKRFLSRSTHAQLAFADKNRISAGSANSPLLFSILHSWEMRLSHVAHLRDLEIMVITLALLVLWILSMYFYLPLPVVVLLFAALATGATMTVWQAWMARKQRLATIGEQDSKS